MDKIIVQKDDFDLSTEVGLARENNPNTGAVVSFVGTVRDLEGGSLVSMTLEHYPQMTEKSLQKSLKKQESDGVFNRLLSFIELGNSR